MTKEEIILKANEVLADEFEVVVLIEKNFGITLTAPDFIDVKTFEDFYTMLEKKLNE